VHRAVGSTRVPERWYVVCRSGFGAARKRLRGRYVFNRTRQGVNDHVGRKPVDVFVNAAAIQRCQIHYAALLIMPTSVAKPAWEALIAVKNAA
jgi:hypothetical protein